MADRRRRRLILSFVLAVSFLFVGSRSSFAQPPSPAPPTIGTGTQPAPENTPPPADQPSPAMIEAKDRFTRGLKLYQDKNYEAARVEFERAYALAPSYKLLYNIGYCYRQLNDYVAAIKALERFMAEGDKEIPADRREEVTTSLADLKTRIASIEVSVVGGEGGSKTTPVVGAVITVDDVPVGTSPLREPIVVNPGRRKISASEKGGTPVTQVITVGGRETARVTLELTGPRTIVVEKKNASLAPIVAWSVTGALVAGTVITGVLALNAESDQRDMLKSLGPNPQTQQKSLDDARDKTQTLSAVSDGLLAASIVGAGVSTILTIRALTASSSSTTESKEKPAAQTKKPKVQAGFTGTGLLLSGSF
jgi:hypothetical protein